MGSISINIPVEAATRPSAIRFGSVCSGIEAASVAWHRLGWSASWLAEIEPFPAAVLAHHYPDTPNLGDMTAIAAKVRAGLVAAPDVLVGGTPCQAFSVAGLRQSLGDARGQLSLAFVELANAIDSARFVRGEPAAVVVWENVPGVLSTADNAFGCFLGALAGEDEPVVPPGKKWANAGCVYGPQRAIAWRVLDAQYFGVAQRRRRVFLVASARDGFDPAAILFESEGVRRDTAPRRGPGQDAAGVAAIGAGGGGGGAHQIQPVTEDSGVDLRNGSVTGQVAHTLQSGTHAPDPSGTPHVLTLFDGVHPIQNATRGKSQNGLGVGAPGDPMYTLDRASQHGVAAPAVLACSPPCSTKLAGIPAAPVIGFNARQDPDSWAERTGPLDTNGATQAVAFSCKDHGADATVDMAPTLRAMGHQSTHANGGGQLAVAFAQNSRDEVRLMGGDGGIVGALAAQPGMKQTCYVAQCVTGDITHTLKAEGFDASEDGTGRGQPIVTAYAFQPRIARNGRGDMGEVVAALTAQAGATGKGDAAPCVAITAYDTTQITSAANGSRPQPGDPCHPLAAGAHPPLIVGQDAAAYTTKPHNTTSNQAGKFYEEYTTALDRSSPPPALVHNMAVRRLTPRECERLQGFPDDYTLIPLPMIARAQRRKESAAKYEFYLAARKARHAADGPRYKALGNSMAVPCMAWLGARIALELAARPAR